MRMSKKLGAALLAAVLLVGIGNTIMRHQSQVHVTAYFDQFKGIYVGDDVTVRGVNVGKVTSVDPEPSRVKVEFTLDKDVNLPADVHAAIVAASLVSVRSIILGPAGSGGQPLADNSVIPESRTSVPVEWDDIKRELLGLAGTLGPNGANRSGAVSDLVRAGAKFLGGRGESLHQAFHDVSLAMSTLSDNRGDLFATVRNLQIFATAIRGSDAQVRLFNRNLAIVAHSLSSDRRSLVGALNGLDAAFHDIARFLSANTEITGQTLSKLRGVTQTLSRNSQAMADIMQTGPTALSNLYDLIVPKPGGSALTGALAVGNLNEPANIICGALLALGGNKTSCVNAVGPLAQYLALDGPPVGSGTIQSNYSAPGGVVPPGTTGQISQGSGSR